MKISIITVSLNAADTIEKTLLSIINQTYKDIELIVIDGGSTDGTVEILNKYSSSISVFVSESDTGIYNAMNKGIKLASGDFILFLNANDSLSENNILECTANYLKTKDYNVFFGNVIFVKNKKIEWEFNVSNFNLTSFINENICHQSIFYKKDLFDRYGLYNEEYKILADYDFNLKLFYKHKLKAFYLPFAISRFQLGGISSNPENLHKVKKEEQIILKKYLSSSKKFLYSFLNISQRQKSNLPDFLIKILGLKFLTNN